MILALASVSVLVGTIWLIVLAIQTGHTTGEKVVWALVNFFCQPIGGIIFYVMKRVGLVPLILVIIGVILLSIGSYSMANQMMNQMPR